MLGSIVDNLRLWAVEYLDLTLPYKEYKLLKIIRLLHFYQHYVILINDQDQELISQQLISVCSHSTPKNHSLELRSVFYKCVPGRRKILVKVVDIFGNETMKIIEVIIGGRK